MKNEHLPRFDIHFIEHLIDHRRVSGADLRILQLVAVE